MVYFLRQEKATEDRPSGSSHVGFPHEGKICVSSKCCLCSDTLFLSIVFKTGCKSMFVDEDGETYQVFRLSQSLFYHTAMQA